MGYRWLQLPVFGAFALSMTLAGPALAQYAPPRTPYGGWSGGGYLDYAFDNGYRMGAREGEHDARQGKAYGYKRDDAYEDADSGFRGGDKDRYRYEFRRGYEAGYDTAYRRYARGGWYGDQQPGWYDDRPGYVVTTPVPGYRPYPTRDHETLYARVAYDNGYKDGVEEGHKDFHRGRAFEPARRDRYRDGDNGYEHRYGSRDAYKADYRAGFRAGYADAYRDH